MVDTGYPGSPTGGTSTSSYTLSCNSGYATSGGNTATCTFNIKCQYLHNYQLTPVYGTCGVYGLQFPGVRSAAGATSSRDGA